MSSVYILRAPPHRASLLLSEAEEGRIPSEPVASFGASRNRPLYVFAMFSEGVITHFALGRRANRAGSGMDRLELRNLRPLPGGPVTISELVDDSPGRLRRHLDDRLRFGGELPEKTAEAFVEAMLTRRPGLAKLMKAYRPRARKWAAALDERSAENLGFQKDSLGLALQAAGIDRGLLLNWMPPERGERPSSFLDGMTSSEFIEDQMISADFSSLPGYAGFDGAHKASKVFQDPSDPKKRLTVIMANRHALEMQTGCDLIYYQEQYKSFVLVQYKRMDNTIDPATFRWSTNPDDQLMKELSRMDETLNHLSSCDRDDEPDAFRFIENPFLLKFCPKVLFDPEDKGLFKGIYLPLDLWKRLSVHDRTLGPKGGRVLTYENVGRRLNNTEFLTLLENGWIGTTPPQSIALERIIKSILETGKTVTYAYKRDPPPDPGGVGEMVPDKNSGELWQANSNDDDNVVTVGLV